MKTRSILAITLVLFVTIACSFNVTAPKLKTGDENLFKVNEPIPADRESSVLEIEMGAGVLDITGGSEQWIDGEIRYNVPIWEPKTEKLQDGLLLTQKSSEIKIGIREEKIENNWVLQLGEHPTDLKIKAGAYQGNLNLSGIPLTGLSVKDGASQSTIVFEKPNPVEMDLFTYQTGASQVELLGLANTNAKNMLFQSGPGSYRLDFSGKLQQDMEVKLEFGLGDVEITIPKGIPVYAKVDGGLNNIELKGTWNISGNEYTIDGNGPKLVFNITVGVGNLKLISQ